jgi:U32 family peptidase
MKKIELLAPAGNPEKLKMAIRYGADAVYLAGKQFGLRAYGGNFSPEEMREAVSFVHDAGKKVYVTVNIIPRENDLDGLSEYFRFLEEIGVDAAPVWKEMGAERIVLAREVSIGELADIRRKVDIELEYFVHGAMCISWSGRCLLSNFFSNGLRQSNRGECIQACRFKYQVVEETRPGQYWPVTEDENGSYIFNSKDLCLVDEIPQLIRAGAASLKIEGRMKSVYYVAAVTAAYRRAIDAYYEGRTEETARAELEKVSHRPYTTGFALAAPGEAAQNYVKSQPEQPYDFIALVLSYDAETKTATVEQRNRFATGETVECLTPAGDVFPIVIGTLTNEAGEMVANAPHAQEILKMETEVSLPPYSILRRKL